mmetsp:Transcript_68280/g.163856  ORF Transcript_68280/g.163856 Transcript_68280/m.163856 type:complete len:274 (-) Transcript_68280:563-1384(-)
MRGLKLRVSRRLPPQQPALTFLSFDARCLSWVQNFLLCLTLRIFTPPCSVEATCSQTSKCLPRGHMRLRSPRKKSCGSSLCTSSLRQGGHPGVALLWSLRLLCRCCTFSAAQAIQYSILCSWEWCLGALAHHLPQSSNVHALVHGEAMQPECRWHAPWQREVVDHCRGHLRQQTVDWDHLPSSSSSRMNLQHRLSLSGCGACHLSTALRAAALQRQPRPVRMQVLHPGPEVKRQLPGWMAKSATSPQHGMEKLQSSERPWSGHRTSSGCNRPS